MHPLFVAHGPDFLPNVSVPSISILTRGRVAAAAATDGVAVSHIYSYPHHRTHVNQKLMCGRIRENVRMLQITTKVLKIIWAYFFHKYFVI